MEEDVSISSNFLHKATPTTNSLPRNQSKEPVYHSVASLPSATSMSTSDETSVASSITIESLLSRQSKMDSRIDKVDATIAQILKLLQSEKASNPSQIQSTSETGTEESSGMSAWNNGT